MNAPDDTAVHRRAVAVPPASAPRRRPPRSAWWHPAHWHDATTDVLSFVGALACAVLAAVVAVMLGGCGGGVGSEGTGSFSSNSYATGPITGYGSIVVGGIHFDESTATVHDDDDQALDRSALALGMVVQVSGGTVSTDASGRSVATATQVRAVRALLGQVSARDLAAGTLTVLGQTVLVQADTVIDAALGGGLAGIAAGTAVEVYGSFDASVGAWRASRIAPAPVAAAGAYALRGTVTSVNTAARTAVINGQTYSLAGLADASAVQPGAVLKLRLQTTPDNQGRWVCDGDSDGKPALPSDRDNAQARGRIGSIVGGTRWVVDGTPVDVSAARVTGTPAVGAQAQVSGVLRAGVLVATAATVASGGGDGGLFELEGTPSAFDAARRRFVLRGTTVSFARSDIVWGGGASAAALAGWAGKVLVKGVLSSDRSVLEATRIDFEN